MTGRLSGKRAIVTGGSRGIGAAIALAFASEGADIAICHIDDEEGARCVVDKAWTLNVKTHAMHCDVGDTRQLVDFVASSEKSLGPIDILVSNAGISGETPFMDISLEKFELMINVHLRALFVLSQAVLPNMRIRGSGRIIAISSQLAYKGSPGLVHYCAAKAGITGFIRALAQEVAADGILVNAIAPGPINTRLSESLSEEWKNNKRNQLPIGRFGRPEDIAPTAVLLASDDAAFYVGQTLSPNGGDVML